MEIIQNKKKILERDSFTCQKCGFQDLSGEELEVHHIAPRADSGNENLENLITLCSICHHYSPNSEQELKRYLAEKIDGNILSTFRNSNKSISKRTKKGMVKKSSQGIFLTRPPRGYKLVNKELIIDQEKAEEIKRIFEEFNNSDISLTSLAKKYNISAAGLKKLLQNTTYLGKVKFAKQETQGRHIAILDLDLFQKVQEKLRG